MARSITSPNLPGDIKEIGCRTKHFAGKKEPLQVIFAELAEARDPGIVVVVQ